MPWKYIRVNQDELGSRRACLDRVGEVLEDSRCPIIDRCNISRKQREYFIDLGVPVDCIVLQFDPSICMRRCRQRTDHPSLDANDVPFVVKAMDKEWEAPNKSEGIRSLLTVKDDSRLQSAIQKLISKECK